MNLKKTILCCLAMPLFLASCSKETLDIRNVQISYNKIYSQGSNTPFTGVVTNFPFTKLPIDPIFNLVNKHHKFLKDNGLRGRPELASTGQILLCDVEVVDGLLDGNTHCRLMSEQTTYLDFKYKEGALDGKLTVNYTKPQDSASSVQVISANFKGGQLNGRTEMFTRAGQTIYDTEFENNRPVDSEKFLNGDGKVIIENFYGAKNIEQVKYYHPKTGDLIGESTGRHRSSTADPMNFTGVEALYRFDRDEEGKVHFWLFKTHTFEGGWETGPAVEYDADGNIIAEAILEKGNPRNGKWRTPSAAGDGEILEFHNGLSSWQIQQNKESKQRDCIYNKEKTYLTSTREKLETELASTSDEESQQALKAALSDLKASPELMTQFEQECTTN
ncbi:hypothetical protein LVJ82_04415 [Vitreoscilla massiliensis]|uniref:Uncharacterized protein n=1 Tax=Vitreoscilla massiliensis TaxID=1689272 RepID=A0ABY4E379_9NEIS|nr:hypothetical protein [Vitreoscilla massiliensis]UOO90236.1 hypothetical protein LVJ82_04415 [Vitreoscilla massiliensis]